MSFIAKRRNAAVPPELSSDESRLAMSALQRWATPPRGPQKSDVAHSVMRTVGSVVVVCLLAGAVYIIYHDYSGHYNATLAELIEQRAEAQKVYPAQCNKAYEPSICATWEKEKTHLWSNATIETRADHQAWREIGHHAGDFWASVSGSWSVRLFLIALVVNYFCYVPVSSAVDTWGMVVAMRQAAAAAAAAAAAKQPDSTTPRYPKAEVRVLADDMQPLPWPPDSS
jgi:hypothetical protein